MVKPKVIVTRAAPGVDETMAALTTAGYAGIASPALVLKALDNAAPDLAGINHLVFTSANGVRFFIEAMGGMTESVAGLTAWCVGPATTKAAQAAGFQCLVAGQGNADDLVHLIMDKASNAQEGFLHVANSAAAGNLVQNLNAAGLTARFLALYEAVPAGRLSPEAEAAIRDEGISYILVHSAKGAEGFLSMAAGITLATSIFVAISEAAARPLLERDARDIVYAARPNEDALFDALKAAHMGL